MYFVLGWPQILATNEKILSIVPNSDQSLFLTLCSECISLWYCRPTVQIVKYQRTSKSIQQYGHNVSAIWRSDSSQIVVQTSNDYLLFYQVVISEDSDTILELIEPSVSKPGLVNDAAGEENRVPALVLELQRNLSIKDGITCIMSAEEEVVISTKNGMLCGIEWDGRVDNNFRLNICIPPNYYNVKKEDQQVCHLIDFKYSTIIGGFSLVFSNGLAAFMPLNERPPHCPPVQMISQVEGAVCTAINHRYALLAFGLTSSEGVVCEFDEVNCRYVASFRLSLPSNVYPDYCQYIGPMGILQWTPDWTVLATAWNNGGFALWTVFGSLLSCSFSWNYSVELDNKRHLGPYIVSSLVFGKEGYHLWMATQNTNPEEEEEEEVKEEDHNETSAVVNDRIWLCKLSLAKSVLAANPCSSIAVETVLLATEDRLLVGGSKSSNLFSHRPPEIKETKMCNGDSSEQLPNGSFLGEQESNAMDSFHWITVPLPASYLEWNWPIRYFAIDPQSSQNLAITGLNGLAMYSLLNRRWKLFGNENHERDFVVTGGFLWFHDHLIAGCYNLVQDSYEIRAYCHRKKLDNSVAKVLTIENEVYLLSLHRNRLLALCSNGTILLFELHLFKQPQHTASEPSTELNISAPIRVVINGISIIPDCVTLCLLTDLHVDMYHSVFQSETSHRSQLIQTTAVSKSHSILINICGKLFLLEMDIDTTGLPLSDDDEDNEEYANRLSLTESITALPRKVNGEYEPNTIKYRKASNNYLASNVEHLWILPHDEVQLNAFRSSNYVNRNHQHQLRPHLVTSLYLACGAHGMLVWLSLEHSIRPPISKNGKKDYLPNENEHAYISKRIMLHVSEIVSKIYPLAIRFREAILLGAESDYTHHHSFAFGQQVNFQPQENGNHSLSMPFCLVKRTTQVYLHYILRELLRKNLGYRAWEIANTCTALPHFVHSLELLLHGVLEEEAGSSQPIPDALLPRVVDFIRAFPVFLQTVIHCARKTELALWPHLFSVVGSPKDLFQQCLLEGQLETASSYIIVLQNLEKPEVAAKCATRLLQAARIAGSWVTVKELKRFLRATNYAEESEVNNFNHRTNSISNVEQQSSTGERQGNFEGKESTIRQGSISPSQNGEESKQAEPSNHNYGFEQPSAKGSFSQATLQQQQQQQQQQHQQHRQYSRMIPGAAIKQNELLNGVEQTKDIVMKDTDEGGGIDISDCSLSNSEDSLPVDTVEELSNTRSNANCAGVSVSCNQPRPMRAYPGTILRMNCDGHPNAPFKFLTNSALAAASSPSISLYSVSSTCSSTLSSASVSPSVRKDHRPSINSHSTIAFHGDAAPMLKVTSATENGEANQCVIS